MSAQRQWARVDDPNAPLGHALQAEIGGVRWRAHQLTDGRWNLRAADDPGRIAVVGSFDEVREIARHPKSMSTHTNAGSAGRRSNPGRGASVELYDPRAREVVWRGTLSAFVDAAGVDFSPQELDVLESAAAGDINGVYVNSNSRQLLILRAEKQTMENPKTSRSRKPSRSKKGSDALSKFIEPDGLTSLFDRDEIWETDIKAPHPVGTVVELLDATGYHDYQVIIAHPVVIGTSIGPMVGVAYPAGYESGKVEVLFDLEPLSKFEFAPVRSPGRGATGPDEVAYRYMAEAVKRVKNPATCKRGELKVHRDAYRRSDGTRVAATTYCTPDMGKRGRGPDIVPELREGKLGGPGYTEKSADSRHKILKKCVKRYGYRSCLQSLQYLQLVGRRTWPESKRKKIDADKNWIEKQYGGPGSFGPQRNPQTDEEIAKDFVGWIRAGHQPGVGDIKERYGIPVSEAVEIERTIPHLSGDNAEQRVVKALKESRRWREEKIREVTRSRAAALGWLERVGSWPSSDPDVRAVTKAAERTFMRSGNPASSRTRNESNKQQSLQRLRVHVGPTHVGEFAKKIQGAGFGTMTVGTENIYVDVWGEDPTHAKVQFEDAMRKKYGANQGGVKVTDARTIHAGRSRKGNPSTFAIGDVVRMTAAFRRSTGMVAGGPLNGVVVGGGSLGPYVLWSDAEVPSQVSAGILEKTRTQKPTQALNNARVVSGLPLGKSAAKFRVFAGRPPQWRAPAERTARAGSAVVDLDRGAEGRLMYDTYKAAEDEAVRLHDTFDVDTVVLDPQGEVRLVMRTYGVPVGTRPSRGRRGNPSAKSGRSHNAAPRTCELPKGPIYLAAFSTSAVRRRTKGEWKRVHTKAAQKIVDTPGGTLASIVKGDEIRALVALPPEYEKSAEQAAQAGWGLPLWDWVRGRLPSPELERWERDRQRQELAESGKRSKATDNFELMLGVFMGCDDTRAENPTKTFEKGDIVRHTAKFLKQIGVVSGAPINGVVVDFTPLGGKQLPMVQWSDRPDGSAVAIQPEYIELDKRYRKKANPKDEILPKSDRWTWQGEYIEEQIGDYFIVVRGTGSAYEFTVKNDVTGKVRKGGDPTMSGALAAAKRIVMREMNAPSSRNPHQQMDIGVKVHSAHGSYDAAVKAGRKLTSKGDPSQAYVDWSPLRKKWLVWSRSGGGPRSCDLFGPRFMETSVGKEG